LGSRYRPDIERVGKGVVLIVVRTSGLPPGVNTPADGCFRRQTGGPHHNREAGGG
jgi:hypothetical protein